MVKGRGADATAGPRRPHVGARGSNVKLELVPCASLEPMCTQCLMQAHVQALLARMHLLQSPELV